MSNFDLNFVRYQSMIDATDQQDATPEEDTVKPADFSAITAEAIEQGEIQTENSTIRFKRMMFFEQLSLMLPIDRVACEIQEDGLAFFASPNHDICISIHLFIDCQGKNIQHIKSHYAEMMAQSKQKTVWIDEGEAQTSCDKCFNYFLAKHPMPDKDSYTLLALFELGQNVAAITFSIYLEDHALWNHIAMTLLETVTITEFIDRENQNEHAES